MGVTFTVKGIQMRDKEPRAFDPREWDRVCRLGIGEVPAATDEVVLDNTPALRPVRIGGTQHGPR